MQVAVVIAEMSASPARFAPTVGAVQQEKRIAKASNAQTCRQILAIAVRVETSAPSLNYAAKAPALTG